MKTNQPNPESSPDFQSFQQKFDAVIAGLDREGVTFDSATMDSFKTLLHANFERREAQKHTSLSEDALSDLEDRSSDHSEDACDELEMADEQEEPSLGAYFKQDDIDVSVRRKNLGKQLRNRMFIVGCGAWQMHWENKKKPGMSAKMDEIAEYDEAQQKPLMPSQRELKKSIQPELLKRFSSNVIVMEPMRKKDYLDLIPHFTESLPAVCRALFRKLATEQAEQAHRDMVGMRFFEEILTQTLTTGFAPPAPEEDTSSDNCPF